MPRVVLTCGTRQHQTIEVASGTTLQEVMLSRNPETGNWPAPTICIYEGRPVLRARWTEIVLVDNAVAVFAELPMGGGGGGGGSNPLQMVLQIVVVALAALATWYIGGAGGLAAGGWFAAGSASAYALAGVASAAIMIGGSMLIGALCPPPSVPTNEVPAARAEAASPTYSLNKSSNQARLYQPEPEGFGKLLVTPDVVAQAWGQYIDNEFYLYQVFGCGRGEYVVHEMRFAETTFWRGGAFVGGFLEEGETYRQDIKATLLPSGGWSPVVVTAVQNTTTHKLILNMSAPEGIARYIWVAGYWEHVWNGEYYERRWYGDYWKQEPHTLQYIIEYRSIDNEGIPSGNWKELTSGAFSDSTIDARGYSIPCEIPSGRHEIRAMNASPAINDGRAREKLVWDSLTATLGSIQIQFVPEGGKVTLFPDNVEVAPEVSNQELLAPNVGGAWYGPFPSNPPGTRCTQVMISNIFPRGVGRYNDQGNLHAITVTYEIQYRAIDDNGAGISPWATILDGSISKADLTAQRLTHIFDLPEGRYEFKQRRTSNASGDGRTMDEVRWESMQAILPGSLRYTQSVIAVKIKASNTLSQQAANNFKILQTRKLPLWENGTWTEPRETNSFAAALSHVCKSELGGGLRDSQIDLDALWAIDKTLQEREWGFAYWVDGPNTMWTMVNEWCSAVQVVPRLVGTKLSFVLERENRPVRCVITPHHIVRGSFNPSWATHDEGTPDDVVVEYMDKDAGYALRDVRGTLPESESRQTSRRRPPGVTTRAQAHASGIFSAACNRYRRIALDFELEGMGRLLSRGDVVQVVHPRLRNACCGAVAGWSEAELRLDADGDITISEKTEGEIFLTLTRPDGRPWGPVQVRMVQARAIWLDGADYALLLQQGQGSPFAWITTGQDRIPTVWALQQGREFNRRMLVDSVKPSGRWRFAVHCVNDDPRAYRRDIPVPPWDYRGQLPESTELTAPESLRVRVGGTADSPVLLSSWLPVRGAQSYIVETSTNGTDWTAQGRALVNAAESVVPAGNVWVRVAAMGGTGLQGPWARWSGNTTITVPAAPVAALAMPYRGAVLSLRWPAVVGSPSYTVIVTNTDAQKVFEATLTDTAWTFDPVLQVDADGPWRTLTAKVYAVNEAGMSEPSSITAADPAPAMPETVTVSRAPSDTGDGAVSVAAAVADADLTGYVVLRGNAADFGLSGVLEARVVTALPTVFTGLPATAPAYFRVAAKDAYFDISGEYADLNYSAVATLAAQPAPTQEAIL